VFPNHGLTRIDT